MPSPSNDTPEKVELSIAGNRHSDWSSYEIDSDLMIPADAWSMTLGMSGNEMPPDVTPAAPVLVKIDGQTVLTGRVDEITHTVNKTTHAFSISGRDNAAALLDCSAPIFSKQEATLKEVAAALVHDFGIAQPKILADKTRICKKIAVDPGDTAWNMLARVAEANGLWPWFRPDGQLVIGGPDYSVAPAATLILRRDGNGNNVLSLVKNESVAERFSRVTVYGQAPGTLFEPGRHSLHGSADDTGLAPVWFRPKIVIDHEADSPAVCEDRAEKIISDARLQGFSLTAIVRGHYANREMALLWEPGMRIKVISEPHGIMQEQVFFLMGRKFMRSRSEGTRTEVRLKEDNVWAVNAHPHNRHRRGIAALKGGI
ncbi:MAG: phage tail protein, partial [Gallionellaceae bacterium]